MPTCWPGLPDVPAFVDAADHGHVMDGDVLDVPTTTARRVVLGQQPDAVGEDLCPVFHLFPPFRITKCPHLGW